MVTGTISVAGTQEITAVRTIRATIAGDYSITAQRAKRSSSSMSRDAVGAWVRAEACDVVNLGGFTADLWKGSYSTDVSYKG